MKARRDNPYATLNVPALLFAVALSLGMAVVGGLLTGNQLTQWFATLRKPRLQLPLWGFVCVGLYGYLVDSVIAYRLLTVVPGQTARTIALAALIVVMLYNELWNIVLFRWHNTFAGFLGVLVFLAPLTLLQVTLVLVDHVSAWLVLVYVVWVIGYDIPWAYRLWRLVLPSDMVDNSINLSKLISGRFIRPGQIRQAFPSPSEAPVELF